MAKKKTDNAFRLIQLVGDYPADLYRIPTDGRKWKRLCQDRALLVGKLARYGDPDGTTIRPAIETIRKQLCWSERKVFYVLDSLQEHGVLANEPHYHGMRGTRVRRLDVNVLAAHAPAKGYGAGLHNTKNLPVSGLQDTSTGLQNTNTGLHDGGGRTATQGCTQPPSPPPETPTNPATTLNPAPNGGASDTTPGAVVGAKSLSGNGQGAGPRKGSAATSKGVAARVTAYVAKLLGKTNVPAKDADRAKLVEWDAQYNRYVMSAAITAWRQERDLEGLKFPITQMVNELEPYIDKANTDFWGEGGITVLNLLTKLSQAAIAFGKEQTPKATEDLNWIADFAATHGVNWQSNLVYPEGDISPDWQAAVEYLRRTRKTAPVPVTAYD